MLLSMNLPPTEVMSQELAPNAESIILEDALKTTEVYGSTCPIINRCPVLISYIDSYPTHHPGDRLVAEHEHETCCPRAVNSSPQTRHN